MNKILIFFLLIFSQSLYASSLHSFINQVLNDNPGIQAAKSNVLAANARGDAAHYPLYNPELSAQKQNAIENTASLGLSQTIDWANKRDAREQVGAANIWVARAQLADLRQQLASQILAALANYHAQQRIVSLARERTKLLKKFVNLTNRRYQKGDIARVDLDLANLALAEGLAQQADAEVTANQALQTLRAITGQTKINLPHLSIALPSPTATEKNENQLLSNLPSVRVLSQQYQSARARIKVAERDRYPDPTIGVQGGQSSGDGQNKKLVGVTFSIPLFVRNPYRAEVNAAAFEALEADGKRADMVRQARAEIKSSRERYYILYRATKDWQQASGKPLSDGMQLIERLWQAGEMNSTDYLIQLKQRIDSQQAGVQLRGRAWVAWVDWLKASGQVETWLQSV